MSEANIDGQETQKALADKFNSIAVRRLAIESMEEQIDDYINDIVAIYKKSGEKKSKADIKVMVEVFIDAKKAREEEESKINKSKRKLTHMEAISEEISVLERFRYADLHKASEAYLDFQEG